MTFDGLSFVLGVVTGLIIAMWVIIAIDKFTE